MLNYGLPDGRHDHAALFIMRGELHLTLNGNRIGLLAPAYIDFVLPNRWENIELKGEVEVYLMAAETGFFHEVTSKLRTRISERMMAFAQSPFIYFFRRCCQNGITGFCFVFINDGTDRCISERACPKSDVRFFHVNYGMWYSVNAALCFSLRSFISGEIREVNFLHLAHVHCREHHEVKWYCEQLGISANTLTAVTKRLYGKTARMIIDELLLEEAKLALRKSGFIVYKVCQTSLFFSDQSVVSENSLNGAMVFRQLFIGVRIFQGEIK